MLDNIENTVLVASGKGGVGKSTVAVNLAVALAQCGKRVGLLDADVDGPSIPTMLGEAAKPDSPDGRRINAIEKLGLRVMSMGYVVDPSSAMVWRGPMLAGSVLQLVTDVVWGELDFLIVDMPPGTGDVPLTLAQRLDLTGVLLVTTPQAVARRDVLRSKAMFDKVRVPVLGLVENMADGDLEVFGKGGGETLAEELRVPLLQSLPLDRRVRIGGDEGQPVVHTHPDARVSQGFGELAQNLLREVDAANLDRAAVLSQRHGTVRGVG